MNTPLQDRIELSVTRGLRYDSRTDFSKPSSLYTDYLSPEEVKNTPEGLSTHLREIDCSTIVKKGNGEGFIFSSMGVRMNIYVLPKFRYIYERHKNQKFISKAYDSVAKRNGRVRTVVDGFSTKFFGVKSSRIPEILISMGYLK